MDGLREVIIELTCRCNLACAFCFNKQGKSRGCGELTKAEIIDLLKDIASSGIGAVRFTGGEPFLRADLPEILHAAKQLGLYTIVNSNGVLLAGKSRKIFRDIDLILLSLHGRHWFKKTARALDAVSCSPRTSVMLATIASPENISSLGKFYDFVSQIRIANFKEWFLLRPVPNLANRHPVNSLNLEALYRSVKHYNKKYGMKITIANALPFCAIKDDLSSICKGGKFDSGHSRIFVTSSGQYKTDYFSSVSLGSFKERPLAEVWNSFSLRKVRNYKCLDSSCRQCFYLEKCKGGLARKEYLRKPGNLDPLVSVIIPTFNASARLELVIESLRHQTYRGFEVIVVDDGSSDNTKSLVKRLQKSSGLKVRYYYLHNPDIFGAPMARNLGARMAKGRILVFLDQDAAAERHLVELYVAKHKEHDIILGYYSGYNKEGQHYDYKEAKEKIFKNEEFKTVKPDFRRDIFNYQSRYQNEAWKYFVSANFSIKKSVFREHEFDEKVTKWTGEDIDLGYRLFTNGHRFVFAKDCLAYNIEGSGMFTRSKFITLNEILIYLYGKYKNRIWKDYLFERFYHTPLDIRGNALLTFRGGRFFFKQADSYPEPSDQDQQKTASRVNPRSRTVSFYVPCYNGERYLKQCLQSVLSQNYPLKEVILVDDGSADRTLEIVSRFPIKVISHKHNKGLGAARNTAVKAATGDFVASTDTDCILGRTWLEKLMQQFDSPKVAGAGGRLDNCNHKENVLDQWRGLRMVQHWGDKNINPDFLFGCDTVFSREALLEVGLYDEKLKTNGEDRDISEKLLKKGYELKYSPLARVYHLRKDNLNTLLDTFWRYNFCYLIWIGKYYFNMGGLPDKIRENLWLAKKFMAEDLKEKRFGLLYIDFVLPVYISFRDLQYFFSTKQYGKATGEINIFLSLILESSSDKALLRVAQDCKSQKDAFKKSVLMLMAIINNALNNKKETVGFCADFTNDLLSFFAKGIDARKRRLEVSGSSIPWESIFERLKIKEDSGVWANYLRTFLGFVDGFYNCFPLQERAFRSFLEDSRKEMLEAGDEYKI